MNLDGTFDYSIVEIFLRALRELRGRSLVLRKNMLTTKHTESMKGECSAGCVLTSDRHLRRSRNAEDAESAERKQEKDLGWGFSLSSSASSALSAFQTLCITN